MNEPLQGNSQNESVQGDGADGRVRFTKCELCATWQLKTVVIPHQERKRERVGGRRADEDSAAIIRPTSRGQRNERDVRDFSHPVGTNIRPKRIRRFTSSASWPDLLLYSSIHLDDAYSTKKKILQTPPHRPDSLRMNPDLGSTHALAPLDSPSAQEPAGSMYRTIESSRCRFQFVAKGYAHHSSPSIWPAEKVHSKVQANDDVCRNERQIVGASCH